MAKSTAPGVSSDGFLSAVQHAMPGIANPYRVNTAQPAEEYYGNKPFFVEWTQGKPNSPSAMWPMA